MEENFSTCKVNTPLEKGTLEEYKKNGFSLIGFTYNGDQHCYDYIFERVSAQPFDYENANIPAKDFSPSHQSSRFMFKNALIGLGVKPQTADDWIKVRKAKRAAQTETAFRIIEKQVKLGMETFGVTADDIIKVAIDRNWQGFKCEWLDNIDWKYYGVNIGHTDLPFNNDGGWQ